ncbi:MAG: hypothetical protein AAF203_01085 [Pseudomonadota bacterium]
MKQFIALGAFLFVSLNGFGANPTPKEAIIDLSLQHTSDDSTRPQVRKELDGLITDLTDGLPKVTQAQWAQYAPGSWRQIWSDEADNSPAGSPPRDLEKIFQYVTPQGRAVNFGQRMIPGGQEITFALEAVGSVIDDIQTTEILGAFSRNAGLSTGEDLEILANDILLKENQMFSPIELGTFPKGPVGAKSDLTILYLDNDLKIGTAPNVYSGEIELFVLTRQNQVQ